MIGHYQTSIPLDTYILMSFIAAVSVLVPDYDEAIHYYTSVLGFELIEDAPVGSSGKRFVRVRPGAAHKPSTENPEVPNSGCSLLLAKAKNADEVAHIGNQTGGRVFLFLHTPDFDSEFSRLKSAGVDFTESPRNEEYGKVVVFRDLYGNLWDLVEPLTNAS